MLAVSVFTWTPLPQGLAGFFYLMAAPESDFRARQPDIARILASFRIVGAPLGEAPVPYVRFGDPKEAAFTVEVPAGWNTTGGLFRLNPEDYRIGVETASPDGETKVVLGDPNAAKFIEPTSPYFPEGSLYAPGGFPMLVRRFMSGALYCREYVQTRVAQICPNLQIGNMQDRSDLLPQARAANPDLAGFPVVSMGEVSFRCGDASQPKCGFCSATTAGVAPTWRLYELHAYLSSTQQEPVARSVMEHMGQSFNPIRNG